MDGPPPPAPPPALLRRLSQRLSGSSFFKSVVVLASGTAVGQALIILASPVLSRLYAPEEFGAFAVFSALLFSLAQVASLRYEMAILLPAEEDRAAHLLVLSLAAATGVSAVVALAIPLAGDALVGWTNTPGLRPHLWLLPVSLWGLGTFQALNYWSVRRRAFAPLARANVVQNLVRVLAQVGLGWMGWGTIGLLLGDAAGRAAGSGLLAEATRRRDGGALGRIGSAGMLREAARYRRFPLIASGSGLLNQAGVQAPALLLAGLYGPQVAGWYALGQRVINLPLVMVGHSIAHVFSERASRLAQTDSRRSMERLLWKTAMVLALVGSVPFGLLAAFGPWLFARVFGAAWAETGRYAQVLALMSLCEFVVVPLSQTFAILERQTVQLGWDAGRLLSMVAVLVLAARGGLPPFQAVALFGGVMALAYLALFLLMLGATRTRAAVEGRPRRPWLRTGRRGSRPGSGG